MTSELRSDGSTEIRVWDPLVRTFHWSLVLSFSVAYISGEDESLSLHVWAGYLVGGLVLFRLLWGVVGTRYARFSNIVHPPAQILAYARDLMRGNAQRYLGHNPLGGAMVVALLITLSLATLTGLLLYGAEDSAGPFAGWMQGAGHDSAEWLEELHEFTSHATLALVTVHIAGVLVSSWAHRENLIRAMFTGRKRP